jgi:ubiquinone/menaquinone biosynthesis C-methylase UbiE
MGGIIINERQLFDEWPERYDRWFETPIGKLIKELEGELIHKFLDPKPGEMILDAGCGTAVFTLDLLARGTKVVGLDISRRMLKYARNKATSYPFYEIQGDICGLPFKDNSFEKSVSITAIEFVEEAKRAIDELFRVTQPGGRVVVATLNSLSPWAARRKSKTLKGQKHILENAFFRSPYELLSYSHLNGVATTAIHFQKDDYPEEAIRIEKSYQSKNIDTGAFVIVRWEKPL